ncbi:hypothetical protein RN001_009568 [Aquatica leii]|uniref:Putative nuclease HARBI1 n=1 Tax=Aquatica leii TaxID=1421715 RepID=A0AAN7P5F3_9COLE|nr:hypothetical protein RN001_009568 [Aquatica leii]
MDGLIDIPGEMLEAENVREVEEINNIHGRNYQQRINPLNKYDDKDFRSMYRINKETARFLINLVRRDIETNNSKRGLPIDSEIQVLATLRYFAKGGYQNDIAEIHGMSQSTLSRTIKKVVSAVARHRHEYIKFPVDQESIRTLKRDFFNIAACPSIVGAIDGTHIKIKNPGKRDLYPLTYQNRKGFFSLNVQVVCDAKCRVLDIVTRWRGSVHDSRIWHECELKNKFERREINGILLGDSGYPSSRYLLTPLLNPQTLPEERYNRSHIQTRNVIERFFGIWNNKFRCFLNRLHIDLNVAKNALVALAVIHNIYMEHRDNNNDSNEEDNDDNDSICNQNQIEENQNEENCQRNAFRQIYINRHFQ